MLAFVLSACGGVKLLPLSPNDLERGKSVYPQLSMEELQKGKENFELYCSQCHGLKNPKKHDAEGWKKTVNRMAKKAENKSSIKNIEEPIKASILTYLVTMSSAENATQ
jgi:cytochrome c5